MTEVRMAYSLLLNRPANLKGAKEQHIERLGTVLWRTRGSVGTKIANLKARAGTYGKGLGNGKNALEDLVIATWQDAAALQGQFARDVMDYVGKAWDDVDTHPWTTRRGAATSASEPDRRRGPRRPTDIMAASIGLAMPATQRTTMARDGRLQAIFREAVMACYETGAPSSGKCPGCGHDRTKSNGDPLLEAHHLVPFELLPLFDHRVGIPLCPNCHALTRLGTIEQRIEITEHVLARHPSVRRNLEQAWHSGLLTTEAWNLLVLDGWVQAGHPPSKRPGQSPSKG